MGDEYLALQIFRENTVCTYTPCIRMPTIACIDRHACLDVLCAGIRVRAATNPIGTVAGSVGGDGEGGGVVIKEWGGARLGHATHSR